MDRVFPVDDMADHFWAPPAVSLADEEVSSSSTTAMNRSSSVWAFERFIRECNQNNTSGSSPPSSSFSGNGCGGDARPPQNNPDARDLQPPSSAIPSLHSAIISPALPMDSDGYQAFLKSRLNLACAAALTRVSQGNLQGPAAGSENGVNASFTSQLESQPISIGAGAGAGCVTSKALNKDASGGPLGIPSLPTMQKRSVTPVKSLTSGSEQSDDDEADEDAETAENIDPSDAKRVRRMLSNRESARRSRKRKQAHLSDLETQASQLHVEKSSLIKNLTELSQKYNEAAVDNRVLKADVETLRAKVKMAEETVKRVTGLNPFLQAIPDISTIGGMASFSNSPSDASTASVQEGAPPPPNQQHLYHSSAASNNHMSTTMHNLGIQNGFVADNHMQQQQDPAAGRNQMVGIPAPKQTRMENLKKRI